jgi:hypothetical protein
MHTGPSAAAARVAKARLEAAIGTPLVGPTAAPKEARCFRVLETRVTATRVAEAAAMDMQAAILLDVCGERTGVCGNGDRG